MVNYEIVETSFLFLAEAIVVVGFENRVGANKRMYNKWKFRRNHRST